MEPDLGQETGHSDEQESDRTGRIAKWAQQSRDYAPAAFSVATYDEVHKEAGLLSDLHDECLRTIRQLRSTLEGASRTEARPDDKARLTYCYAQLNLWGDALHEGNLEASLRIVPALRSTILEALIRIGQALILGLQSAARATLILSERTADNTQHARRIQH